VQQLRLTPALRSISKPLKSLWEESMAVAAICHVVARRTEVNPEEAFLAGLLHGIGRLYIMVRTANAPQTVSIDSSLLQMIDGWHPPSGKRFSKTGASARRWPTRSRIRMCTTTAVSPPRTTRMC